MKRSKLLALCVAVLFTRSAWGLEPVSVAADADRGYVLQKFGDGPSHSKTETYLFAKGSFFDGSKTDSSLESTSFADIVHELASDLAAQRYYPSKDPKAADLLIVVHWGMTGVEDDATNGQADMDRLTSDLAKFNGGLKSSSMMDPGFVNSDLAVIGGKTAQAGTGMMANAQLTGYISEFRKEEYRSLGLPNGMSEEDHQMREDLNSERYFVILMAYDYGSLANGRKKGVKPKLLWSTHISISAIGQNFKSALPAMGKGAAGYFGHQVDGLLLNIRSVPTGNVKVGIPRTVDEPRAN